MQAKRICITDIIMDNGYLNILEEDIQSNLSKKELFERIKNKCKSKTKKSLLTGLVILLLGVAFLVSFWFYGMNEPSIILVITLAIDGFLSLGEYCSNKKMGNFDAPDKLIKWLDNDSIKRVRHELSLFGICMIGYLIYYHISHTDISYTGLFPFILILVALVVMFIHLLYYGLLKNKIYEDEDIKNLRNLLNEG